MVKGSKEKSKERMRNYVTGKISDERVRYIALKLIDELWAKQDGNFPNCEKVAAAVIYIAYRKALMPKNLEEIYAMCQDINIKRRDIHRRYKFVRNLLGMEYCETASQISPNCIVNAKPEMFIEKIARKIDKIANPDEVITIAFVLAERYREFLASKSPSTSAAVCVYIAAKEKNKITQLDVCYAAFITETTLRNTLKELIKISGVKNVKKGKWT